MLTVNWKRYHYYQKKIWRGQGAPVFVEGAPVPRHNGTMASPSLNLAWFSAQSVCMGLAATNSTDQRLSLCIFKSRLKTFLFTQAFAEHWSDLPPAPLKLWPRGDINSINTGIFYIRAVNPQTRHPLPIHIPVLRPTRNGPAERLTRATSWFCVRYSALSRIPCSFARKKISTTFTICFISFLGTRKIQVNLCWTNIIKVCRMRLCGSVKELQF